MAHITKTNNIKQICMANINLICMANINLI